MRGSVVTRSVSAGKSPLREKEKGGRGISAVDISSSLQDRHAGKNQRVTLPATRSYTSPKVGNSPSFDEK